MKYLKLALALMLVVCLVANVTFAAGRNLQSRGLTVPERTYDQASEKGLAKGVSSQPHARPVLEKGTKMVKPNTRTVSGVQKAVVPTMGAFPKNINSAAVSGTYTVGAAGDFPTLGAMASFLNFAHISGPTVFELLDASYTESGVVIGNVSGTSATNTVTIRPTAANTACVMTLTDIAGVGGLTFGGTNYLTLEGTAIGEAAGSQNLKILLSAGADDAPVRVNNGKHLTITDCEIVGSTTATYWAVFGGAGGASVLLTADAGDYNSYVTVNNCNLHGGHFGVQEFGNMPVIYPDDYGIQDDHTTISNCYIHDCGEDGLDLQQVSYAHVTGNIVKRIVLASSAGAAPFAGDNYPIIWRLAGIQVWGDHMTIDKNLVDSIYNNRTSAGTFSALTYGIRMMGLGNNDPDPIFGGTLSWVGVPSTNVAINNIVTRLESKATQTNMATAMHEIGIDVVAGRQDTLYHNTVYFSGAENPSHPGGAGGISMWGVQSTASGFPVWVDAIVSGGAPSRTYVKNNIVAIDRTGMSAGKSACVVITGPNIDYRGGSDNNVYYMGISGNIAITAAGAAYASVAAFHSYNSTDLSTQADDPTLVSETNVHINPAGFSTADGTGANLGGRVTKDYYDSSRTTPPDIGAVEGTGAGAPHDVKGFALLSPGPAGVPAGLPFGPLSISVQNLTLNTEPGVSIGLNIIDPSLGVTSFGPVSHTVPAVGFDTATFAGPWTPAVGGDYIFKIYAILGGDNYPGNDTFTVHVPVAGLVAAYPYITPFESSGDRDGWFADGDMAIGTSFTKLGGAHGGTHAYVTKPGAAGSGINDKTVSHLYSTFFDLRSVGNAVISFYHSLQTEPEWDRSIFEYSVDTGKTWQQLGVLNDTNGINWYGTAVYNNAGGPSGFAAWDTATAKTLGFPTPATANHLPPPCWTGNGDSQGDDAFTGPTGYVYVQFNMQNILPGLTPGQRDFMRFRYTSFTDAGTHGDGWAVDDFSITTSAPTILKDTIRGKVYTDANGNGTFDGGDAGIASAVVNLTYFGVASQVDTADGSGNYEFILPLPGLYSMSSNAAGLLSSEPAYPNIYAINSTASAALFNNENLGRFAGTLTGHLFSDSNNDTLDESEPGLEGYNVEVHRDSTLGQLVNQGASDVNGDFSITVPRNGTYYVYMSDDARARLDAPKKNSKGKRADTVVVASGAGVAANHFGAFVLGQVYGWAAVDQNGDGTRDLSDLAGLPAGYTADLSFAKGVTALRRDTVGNGSGRYFIATGLDTGTYTMTFNGYPSNVGGLVIHTNGSSFSTTITSSGQTDSLYTLHYKKAKITGTIYNDLNGNGTKDLGEPGLAAWTVRAHGDPTRDTTNGSGVYTANVTPGGHIDSLDVQAGWIATTVTTYTVAAQNSGGTSSGKDFGVYHNGTYAGKVFRDRNHNSTLDTLEEGVPGAIVVFAKVGGGLTLTDTSDAFGLYSLSGFTIGNYELTVTMPAGFTQDTPAVPDTVGAVSNTTVTLNVGALTATDVVLFRTIPADSFGVYGLVKANKAWKASKPTYPNYANLLLYAYSQFTAAPTVGKSGLTSPINGKPAPYLQPAKYTDALTTFDSKKGGPHTGASHGLDFNNKGGMLNKLQKSLGSDKHNNLAVAHLLALQINIQMSDDGVTPTGLGALMIKDGGPYDGMLVADFADSANGLMTNWQFVTAATYQTVTNLASRINNAFTGPFVADTAVAWKTGVVSLTGGSEAGQSGFLKVIPGAKPKSHREPFSKDIPVPDAYAMYQNYPNPFNPSTMITFDLPEQANVTLKVYNMLGQEVATLLNNENLTEGQQELTFNANAFASGVYFYRITAASVENANGQIFTQVKKMALIK